MPAKNSRKQYVENGIYHLYNRGVEKRSIFQNKQDYAVFISYLRNYLMPKDTEKLTKALRNPTISPQERNHILKQLQLNNFHREIQLLCYCLMKNHFHIIVQQKSPHKIDSFMNSLCTRYTMYFNRRYKRVGTLFEGVYKAVLVNSDEQLLELSRYIHHQAINNSQPSSYSDYVGKTTTSWLSSEMILTFFSKFNSALSYADFADKEGNADSIRNLTIEK